MSDLLPLPPLSTLYCYLNTFCVSPAGSMYTGPVHFDVTKAKIQESKSADSASSAADAISVTIPREYRGNSEILVFLSPQPIQS